MQTFTKPIENADKILHSIRQLLAKELNSVDILIKSELYSSVPLTEEITQHIFKSGGKRLRPLLLILSAKACAPEIILSPRHYELAAVIEFVHTATLLHDDVIDNSDMRRGKKTANAIWNNQATILVGDFLYSRAFEILARQNNPQVMEILAGTTNAIAEGELRQLMNQYNTHLTEENYFKVVTEKTAKLFSAAAQIGAILSGASPEAQNAMAQYGLHIGIAFQLIDDLLDYASSAKNIGKNLGDDLAESKTTLPIIYAIQASDEAQANFIRQSVEKGDLTALDQIIEILKQTNALEKTKQEAIRHSLLAKKAIAMLPHSEFTEAVNDLLTFAINRSN